MVMEYGRKRQLRTERVADAGQQSRHCFDSPAGRGIFPASANDDLI